MQGEERIPPLRPLLLFSSVLAIAAEEALLQGSDQKRSFGRSCDGHINNKKWGPRGDPCNLLASCRHRADCGARWSSVFPLVLGLYTTSIRERGGRDSNPRHPDGCSAFQTDAWAAPVSFTRKGRVSRCISFPSFPGSNGILKAQAGIGFKADALTAPVSWHGKIRYFCEFLS